jgi:hypothetical protein
MWRVPRQASSFIFFAATARLKPIFGFVRARFFYEHPTVCTLLVENTDRLYRNLKDWVTIDELEVEVHFAI